MTNQKLEKLNKRIDNALKESRQWNDIAAQLIEERRALLAKPEIKEQAARVVAWLCSPEGQEAMRKAAADSQEFADALERSRHIPLEMLHAPFTI